MVKNINNLSITMIMCMVIFLTFANISVIKGFRLEISSKHKTTRNYDNLKKRGSSFFNYGKHNYKKNKLFSSLSGGSTFAVKQVSTKELEKELLTSNLPILLDCFATWCPPCKTLSKELEIIAQRYGNKLKILKIDVDEETEAADELDIRGLPSLFFVPKSSSGNTGKKLNEVKSCFKHEGGINADNLAKMINLHLIK